MKKLIGFLFTPLFLIFVAPFFLAAQSNSESWTLKTQDANIMVYTRPSDRSSVNEVRITATFNVELNVFMDALNDVENYDQWVYKGINPEHLGKISDDEFYYYIQSDLPFPLNDRDLVVHSKQRFDPVTNTYHTRSVTASDKRKEEDGIVRIELYESSWMIHQNDNGTIYIDYKVIADPAGSLPAWLINMAVTQGPIKTMKSLEAFAIERAQLADKN